MGKSSGKYGVPGLLALFLLLALALAACGGSTVDVSEEVGRLSDPDPFVRTGAQLKLQESKDVAAVVPLLGLLGRTADPEVQQSCVQLLGALGDPRAVQPLVHLLARTKDPYVQAGCVGALGALGDPRAVEPLLKWLGANARIDINAFEEIGDDPDDPGVAYTVIHKGKAKRAVGEACLGAIIRMGSRKPLGTASESARREIAATCMQGLRSANGTIACACAYALGHMGDTRAKKPLISVLKRSATRPATLQAASLALGELCRENLTALAGLLRQRATSVLCWGVCANADRGVKLPRDAMVYALNHFGTKQVALAYVSTSDQRLQDAANDWASVHGYYFVGTTVWAPE